jgi:hypothetical protein
MDLDHPDHEAERSPEHPHGLSPEQLEMLGEFADNMLVARRMRKLFAWLFGSIGAIAAVAYYVLSVWRVLHPGNDHN